jgi:hypothetical protein
LRPAGPFVHYDLQGRHRGNGEKGRLR